MRIGVGAYLLHSGADYRAAGVSRYTHELLLHLPSVGHDDQFVAFTGPKTAEMQAVETRRAPLPTQRPPIRILWEQLVLPSLLRSSRIDVFHGTVNVVPLVTGVPTVLTLHDLSFLRLPDRFARQKVWYLRTMVRASARKARYLIAVSEHTRQEAIALLGIAPEQISTVYNGVDARFQPMSLAEKQSARLRLSIDRPVILHVGTLEPRKNVDVLIRAFAEVQRRLGIPHVLMLVGAPGWMYSSLYDLVKQLRVEEHVRFVGHVPSEALPLWYNCADLFVYPSAYEGFGLPVVEAMACGVPTITSRSSALAEVAGDACILVEPGSPESLEEAMVTVLHDSDLQARLRKEGLARASMFSWSRTASETAAIYHRARQEHFS